YGAPGGGYPPQGGANNPYGNEGERGAEKKKSGSSGMLLGAAGGLAVGAVGGALIANALNDSDSENEHAAPAPAPAPTTVTHTEYHEYHEYREAPPADPYAQDGPPAVLPPTDADGNSVSSSDREDVQEAREEYEEALAAANDSDASSSELEELEEAREAYEEAYEEVYED
ncbi:hypothetical protein N0V84_003943, partial [Fusarium piperis]